MDHSLSELSEVFACNIDTGELTYLPRDRNKFSNDFNHKMWNAQYSGKVLSATGRDGYIKINACGLTMPAHRAIWVFANGSIPADLSIDHINHIRHDNRIGNLRLVTAEQNQRNQSMHSRNVSGVNGVQLVRRSGKWLATISHDGNQKSLGTFSTVEAAAQARKKADRELGFHDNHGRDRLLDVAYVDPWNLIN